MKRNISKIIIGCAIMIGLFSSCDKDKDYLGSFTPSEGLAYLKILNYAPGFRLATNSRDSFNVFVNGNKVNGAFLTYNSMFPSIGTPYIAVPAGAQSIRFSVNGVLTPDSITIGSFSKTLQAGSYYSFIITDSILKGNETKQMFLKDEFVLTDTGSFSLRFVHAILNDSVGKNVDIYSVRNQKNLFSNITPGTATSFTTLQYTFATDTLIVRRPGLLYPLDSLKGAGFARRRAYTIVYKGQPGTTTGAKARLLVQYTNL